MSQVLKIFEPDNNEELLRGWLLHAHKGRDRHDESARHFETRRYRLGVPAVVISAIVGTSVLSTLSKEVQASDVFIIIIGLFSITASVLSALQTLFNYAERAEKHRIAGVKYKALIRELEQVLTGQAEELQDEDKDAGKLIRDMRNRLDALEEEAPFVAHKIYKRIELEYSTITFVSKASEIYSAE